MTSTARRMAPVDEQMTVLMAGTEWGDDTTRRTMERELRAVASERFQESRRVPGTRPVVERRRKTRSGSSDATEQVPAEPALEDGPMQEAHEVPAAGFTSARYSRRAASNSRMSSSRVRLRRATVRGSRAFSNTSRIRCRWCVSHLK